jgi:hypothetical protein
MTPAQHVSFDRLDFEEVVARGGRKPIRFCRVRERADGDTIQVVQDRRWVSFMRSFPNLVPLDAVRVRRIIAAAPET